MSGLPSGTVTFVFSDIEGSTTLLKALGDRYGDVLSGHRSLMRECFTTRGGVEIDTQGDAFFFAFPRARDAVAAAVEAQREHASHEWPDGHAVRVRMGLHTGEPAVGSEGYLGIDVVRAARLCTVGRGGQVLLSETTRALVGGSLPDGVAVHMLGERRLKDIDEPEHVFELDIEGAPVPVSPDAPAEAAVPPPGQAVPTPPTVPTPGSAGTPESAVPTPGQGAPAPAGRVPTGPLPFEEEDFGSRLSRRIQEHVRRKIEEPLERMFSDVDKLADKAVEHPEKITEKLDSD
jgi:class 3 adenylate cyclase